MRFIVFNNLKIIGFLFLSRVNDDKLGGIKFCSIKQDFQIRKVFKADLRHTKQRGFKSLTPDFILARPFYRIGMPSARNKRTLTSRRDGPG